MACGGGGGKVVCMIAFLSDDATSNPAEVYFSVKCLKRTKINKKGWGGRLKNRTMNKRTLTVAESITVGTASLQFDWFGFNHFTTKNNNIFSCLFESNRIKL